MLQFNKVESSSIDEVAYDEEKRILYVRFNNCRLYSYQDVPLDVFDFLLKAESVGRFFASQIKNRYTTKELEGEPE